MSGLKLFRLLSFCVLLLAVHPHACAQESEQALKEQAAALFDQEKYLDATSLYLRLLALNPRSYDYNYRYGTCLLFNSYKKQDAFKYLNYAVTDPGIDIQAFYFLGKAYHLNYQFNEAIKNYELYRQKAAGKPKPSFEVDRQIEMCQNGKRLLTTISDLVVLEKKEIEVAKFFRLYDLRDIGGDILVAADYQSKIDKKKGHIPLIHFPADSREIYYASYGDSDKGQKDIYVRKKLPDGSWSLPQPVRGNVNTNYDEDFPYMNPNGEYLYFCSKGHNSMGGYDIFRSKYDAENGTFGTPENMDFAISSPDNDLFFVVDSLDRNAYFASSRQSANGKMYVYKVRVERVPLQIAVVKGTFSSTIHPDNKKITITVSDYASGEKIGSFTSNEKGSYLITFPKGGKYTYEMKVEGSANSHKYVVSIPFLKEFKPLKQKIQEELLEEAEVVKVVDQFNEDVDDPMGVLAEVIKLRSELNPNASQFNLEELDSERENEQILAALGFANAGPQEITSTFEQLEKKQEEKVKTADNLANGALANALKDLDEAAKKQEEAKTLVNRANAAETKEQKFDLLTQAQEKVTEAADLKADARSLVAFADSVAKKGSADRELLASIDAVTQEVKKEVAANNIPELKNLLTANSRTIEAVKGSEEKDPVAVLIEQKQQTHTEKTGLEQQLGNYTKTEEQLQGEVKTLEASLPTAKKKDQPGIESTIAARKNELAMVSEQKQHLDTKIAKAARQENALDERIRFLQDVTQTGDPRAVSPAEVQAKLSAVDSKNSNTLASYINQQVTELKKDPALLAATSGPDPVVETLEDSYDDRVASITQENFGSPKERTQKLLDADKEFADAVDTALAKADAELKSNPSDAKAQERRKSLAALKEKTETRIAEREQTLAAESAPPETITPETELAALAPGHEKALESARGENAAAQLEEQNRIDGALLEKIDAALTQVGAELKSDPSNPKAQARQTALAQLKTDTQEAITDRKALIAQLENAGTITPETELAAIAPGHDAALEAANGATPKATLEAKNGLDKQLVAKIDAALADTENALKNNPGDAAAKERKTALTELKSTVEERISGRATEIAALNETPSTAITPETELAVIAPEHAAALESAKGSTPKATLEAKNGVDAALAEKIEDALAAAEKELEADPANHPAQERKQALTALKTQAEERMAGRSAEIAELNETTGPAAVTAETELAALVPDYEEQLASATGDTPQAALEAKNAVDRALVAKIDSELEDVEGQLLRNPDNTEAQQRQTALSDLKTQAAVRIQNRTDEIAGLTSEPATQSSVQAIAERIRPEYRENVGKIEATMDDGPQKELALLKEEKDLLAAIEKQLAKKETEAAKNPGDAHIANELKDLQEAQSVQEAQVNERELNLVAAAKAQIDPLRLQSDVMPAYREPDIENRENYTASETAGFAEQEQHLQEQLTKRLRANEKKLEKAFDPEQAAENGIIATLIDQSAVRAQQLTAPVTEDPAVAERIAADLGADNDLLMNSRPTTVDEAKRIITELKEYEAGLAEQLNTLTSADPQDETAIAQQKKQLAAVRKRIGIIEANLDEMESSTAVVEGPADPSQTAAEKELKTWTDKETQLEQKLADPSLTAAEKRTAEKDLAAVRTQKQAQETVVLKEELATAQTERKTAAAWLAAESTDEPAVKASLERSNDLTAPAVSKPTNRDLEKQVQQEEQATVLLATAKDYAAVKATFDEKGLVTASRPELEAQKRRFSIEIGQLESMLEQLSKDPSKTAQAAALQSQKRGLESAVASIDAMIAQLDAEAAPENPVKKGLETPLTYEREVELASSPAYPPLLDAYREVQSTQRQLADILKEKAAVRTQLAAASPAEKSSLVAQLENLSAEEKTLRTELARQQTALDERIAGTENPEQLRNLLARDIAPVKPVPVATVLTPAMTTGFELVATPPATRTETRIPVDLKTPSGLVYRVQVGAFAKPIPEDLFREFTPVTGEKLTNGITRYLAGYFGNRTKVVEAQRQIRALGYSDAFVVAYCDGNRITLAEARRLEDLGLCVPKNQDSLMLEVVENTLAQLPADSLEKLRPVVKPSDYNKAPGAVKAEAAEDRKGLYYTVQVGVYNRPVSAEQVKNIDPLITKRLANGQLRYSSGIFQSIAEARPKRAEAITRGISDAFITAYYNGERISLDEANRILADNGPSVLEQQTTPERPDALQDAQQYAATQPAVVSPQDERVQFVSKERYETYPRDAIARLNSHGSFYYDAADQRIKSVEYVPAEALALPNSVAGELDTLRTVRNNALPFELKPSKIVAMWDAPEISGAAADWMLRLTLPHAGTATENGFELSFEGVPAEEQAALMKVLESYGASKVSLEEEKRQ